MTIYKYMYESAVYRWIGMKISWKNEKNVKNK